ncbi:MAG: transcription antitermination factor NusB [bacterium]|nr:transcription antitermination factor NusB [bacterium]
MMRRKGRSLALQLLFAVDLRNEKLDEVKRTFLFDKHVPKDVKDFVERLCNGVQKNISLIDHLITTHCDNWKLDRLSIVDRNILRIAVFEILYCSDIPDIVSINEAIELAKKYSGKESGRFVNGILDKIREEKNHRNQEKSQNSR